MTAHLYTFWKAEQGQDLMEYTLLLGFVVLASAGLFLATGTGVSGVWRFASAFLGAVDAFLAGGGNTGVIGGGTN